MIYCAYDELVSLKDLKPHPQNRNKHPPEQITRLCQIIKYQGIRSPIKVSKRSGFITAGHGRLLAFKALKLKQAPVNFQDYESEEQEYADLQSDNAIALWAELDLSSINNDLKDLGPDFDIDLLGIKDFTLDVAEKIPPVDEDEIPDHAETRSQPGDRWLLGKHVLVCGDASEVTAIESLLRSEKADLVLTDPPYNLGGQMNGSMYSGATHKNAQGKLKESGWDTDFDIKPVIRNLLTFLSDNASMYIFTSHFLAGDIWAETKESMDCIGWCVWEKPNPSPSLQKRHWTWCAELICYATKGKHVFNFPFTGHAPNVWHFNKEVHTEKHPTQKPISLLEHAILHSSDEGQVVLDPFGGSGSTLIACEKTNRKCFMMEIDPHYCDVILARWEKYSGQKAKLSG